MKKLFVFISILYFSTHVFSQDVGVILHAPANATQGQEFEISLTVNKADVTGFARIQLDLPVGFSVKASQTKGSTFSFKDNKVRFLWMSLPADRTLEISCLATADNSVSGNVNIEGAFSYVLNNETQRYAIPSQTIQFGGSTLASSEENNKLEAERLEKERQEKLAIEKAEHEKEAIEKAEKEAQEEAERVAQQYAQNQNTTQNVTSEEVKTEEIAETGNPEIKNTEQNLSSSEETINTTENTTSAETTTTETNTTEETTTVEPVTNTTSSNTNSYTTSSNSYATTSSAASGVVEYKVQIGAFKASPAPGYFKKLENNISEFRVKSSNDPDGFVRYFVGSFDNFSSVDSFHKRVMQLGYSSFIVANKEGKRITIKEAKEISKN